MMVFLNRFGWPVERIKGRRLLNAIRFVIHTRKIISKQAWKDRMEEHRQKQLNRAASAGPAIRKAGY